MRWVNVSRVLVAFIGWILIFLSVPSSYGEYVFSIIGLGFGSFLFDFHHSSLMQLIISNRPVDWSILTQKDLYCGLLLGFSLQAIGLVALMMELRKLYSGHHCGLIGVGIWLGVGATIKIGRPYLLALRQKNVFSLLKSMNK